MCPDPTRDVATGVPETSPRHPTRLRSVVATAGFLIVLIGCVLAVAPAADLPALVSPTEPGFRLHPEGSGNHVRSFGDVVRSCFEEWDANGDGRLESREIDALMPRHGIKGEAAAALAVIKLRERKEPVLKRRQFSVALEQLVGPRVVEEEVGSVDAAHEGHKPFSYDAHYRRNLGVLTSLKRTLYAGKGPDFRKMRQGEIGDCYFFSLTGYLAAREPGRIVRMIQPEASGHFLVHFPNGERLRVPSPTDAEILVNNSASSLEDGLWLPVLEIALGEIMYSQASALKRTAEVTDAMASGGRTILIIHLYSGHGHRRIPLRELRYAAHRLAELRSLLPEVLDRGMLAGVSMAENPPHGGRKVPGLGYGHAYAILAFDPGTDTITLWNPWGNTFQPKGPGGAEHGFPTEHGVFRLPLTTLYHQFSAVQLETLGALRGRR